MSGSKQDNREIFKDEMMAATNLLLLFDVTPLGTPTKALSSEFDP